MKIRLLQLDDWTALYVNGNLVMQNHELEISDVIKAVSPSADFKCVWMDSVGDDIPETWTEELENEAE